MYIGGVPGSNLLLQALRLISPTRATYYKYAGKETLPNRVNRDFFEPGVIINTGNTQAMPAQRAAQLGINSTKKTWTWRCNYPVRGVDQTRTPDKVVIHTGAVCDVFHVVPWDGLDGWVEVGLVENGETVADIRIREPQ